MEKIELKINIFKGDSVMKKIKLWLVAVMMILCMGVVTGCFSSKDNNDNGSNTQGSSVGNENNQESGIGDTSTNGANNTENDMNNGVGNEGSVTDNTGDGNVIEELVTDIGDGIEDIGNGLAGDENSNVNDVTSGRNR